MNKKTIDGLAPELIEAGQGEIKESNTDVQTFREETFDISVGTNANYVGATSILEGIEIAIGKEREFGDSVQLSREEAALLVSGIQRLL